ncbi:hypothetical protein KOW79_001901 [Hemibagrus wyckioides]|uniref:Uncharacterized protein n=1 Tax=Hemibagrus wyckioides TaxID=337641 RepID=A0A9D3P5V0_9TELE|nr:hypothetical protein KOW79_001901 [Hemibagrus wyckioides]
MSSALRANGGDTYQTESQKQSRKCHNGIKTFRTLIPFTQMSLITCVTSLLLFHGGNAADVVPPGKTVDVHIVIGEAKVDLPFTGSIRITCCNGGILEFKTSGTYKGVTYSNGKLGIKGRSGWDIDRFGFIFINTIKSAELTNVEYPNIHEVIPKVKEIDIKSMSYQNNTNTTQQYQIEASEKITPTSSWSVTDQLEITFCLKVKAGIPLLVESSSGYELKVGDIGIKGRSGWDIDRFGFIFINTIKSAELTNVEYPNIHEVIPKVKEIDIKSMSYQNNTNTTQQYQIEASEKITPTSSWSVTDQLEITFCLKVKAGIPLLVESSSGYELKVGDIGIKGRSGWDIDRFGFIFINTIKSAELTNVEYPNIHEVIPKVKEIDIKSMSYQNNTNTTQQYQIEASEKITPTSSWSVTDQLEITFCLKVKAGIPLLVESSSGYELKVGDIGTYASVTTEEKMEFFPFSFKVPPGKTMDARTVIGEANVNLPFTGIIKITCCNDRVLEFGTSGTYKGVSFSDGKVVVNESTKTLGVA